jgi:threonine dehydrogenase-like Zn-dependent dehydrogenase
MAFLKVLALALATGVLFATAGMSTVEWVEKSVGRGATVVIVGFGCVGLLLGAIAGAAQVVVDALKDSTEAQERTTRDVPPKPTPCD